MSQVEDVLHVVQLVRLSAETIRLVCAQKDPRSQHFDRQVNQLENVADEIEAIAFALPMDWRRLDDPGRPSHSGR